MKDSNLGTIVSYPRENYFIIQETFSRTVHVGTRLFDVCKRFTPGCDIFNTFCFTTCVNGEYEKPFF